MNFKEQWNGNNNKKIVLKFLSDVLFPELTLFTLSVSKYIQWEGAWAPSRILYPYKGLESGKHSFDFCFKVRSDRIKSSIISADVNQFYFAGCGES